MTIKKNVSFRRVIFLLFAVIGVITLIYSFTLTCKKPDTDESGKVDDLIGKITFKRGTVLVNGAETGIGTVINETDVVKTKKKSMAVIQFGSGALITVKSNSVFKVEMLQKKANGKPIVQLLQKKGFSFNKVKTGFGDYRLKSPTSVAGVRGTAFSLVVGKKGKTSIKLFEGKVNASPIVKGKVVEEKAVVLKSGQKIVASKKGVGKVSKLAKSEKKMLRSLNKISFVPVTPAEDAAPVTEVPEAKEVVPEKTQELLVPGITKEGDKAEKKMTLAELKAKYGKLSKIITKSGKTYIGIFQQKGNKMEITTVDGVISIPANDIKKISQQ
jgi:hypothetical protein